MPKVLVYTDADGQCGIIVPHSSFKQHWESETGAVGRLYQEYVSKLPHVLEFIACEPEHIPQDYTFREAWMKGDVEEPVKIDLGRAMEIHRTRLRVASNKKIEQLNHELELAEEENNLPKQVAIKSTKRIMRNIHEMNLSHIKNVDQLKQAVPKELHDVWSFYPLT